MTDSLPEQCKKTLEQGLKTLNLQVTEEKQRLLLTYIILLNRWNKSFNLTAVRTPEAMITRHLLDSLSVSTYLDGENIIDVGTGAGLPGIPLAIIFPNRRFTLLDSNGKKVRFLNQVKQTLRLGNVLPVQCRVESYHQQKSYDCVISRAFTSLEKMVEMTQHLVSESGLMQAMKGVFPDAQELPALWKIEKIIKLQVPGLDEQRHLINIRKTKEA